MARYGYDWQPYVSVATRRAEAERQMNALRKEGVNLQPVEIVGRKIATSFWGEAWCDHLESFSDYANRLPRGRTYVRNGSVCHLEVCEGSIAAKVAGSEIYDLSIRITTLPAKKWIAIKKRCSGKIGSLLELLQGKLSHQVMEVVTDRKQGLFPLRGEISFDCDCPDWARMCKHVAAVLYGVGARLDAQPELLFKLRGVDHEELIAADAEAAVSAATSGGKARRLADGDLEDVFGIDLDRSNDAAASGTRKKSPPKRASGTHKKKVKKKRIPATKQPKQLKQKASTKTTTKKQKVKNTVERTPLKKKVGSGTITKKKAKRKTKKQAGKSTKGRIATKTSKSTNAKPLTKAVKKKHPKKKAIRKQRIDSTP